MIFLHRVLREGVVNQIRPDTAQARKPCDFSVWAQHKLRIEAVITLSAKQKQGKLANVILIHQVQPRLLSFQQNCWTVWSRLDDFCTKKNHTQIWSSTHLCHTQIWSSRRVCEPTTDVPCGSVLSQRGEWRHSPAQHGPLVLKETGKSTYRPWLNSGVHKAMKQKGAIFNYRSSYHTFLSTPQAASHLQLSLSWPISTDKKPQHSGTTLFTELTDIYLLPGSDFCALQTMRVSTFLFLGWKVALEKGR